MTSRFTALTARFALAFILVFVAACTGKNPWQAQPAEQGVPAWTEESSGLFDTENGKAFRGLGVAKDIQNLDLGRETAEQKARADVVVRVETVCKQVFGFEYQTNLTLDEVEDFRKRLDQALFEFGNKEMATIPVTKRQWDAESNTWYVRAEYPAESLKTFLLGASALTESEKDHARSHLDKALSGL